MAINYSKGTISHMSEVTSGTSKNGFDWARQNVLIDIPGYQGAITKLSLQASNEMVNELNAFDVGDKVEVGWTIYAREWNGKWYNNVDLVKIKFQGESDGESAAREWNGKWYNNVDLVKIKFQGESDGESAARSPRSTPVPAPAPAPQTKNLSAGELDPAEHADDLPW